MYKDRTARRVGRNLEKRNAKGGASFLLVQDPFREMFRENAKAFSEKRASPGPARSGKDAKLRRKSQMGKVAQRRRGGTCFVQVSVLAWLERHFCWIIRLIDPLQVPLRATNVSRTWRYSIKMTRVRTPADKSAKASFLDSCRTNKATWRQTEGEKELAVIGVKGISLFPSRLFN